MIIDCIADLHGHYPKLDGGDLLIVSGDLTNRDTDAQHAEYIKWQWELPYKKIIFISGNHDGFIERHPDLYIHGCNMSGKVAYLQDSGIEFEGLKIWGSPWTAQFPGINPKCCAFTMPFGCDTEDNLMDKWDLIPHDVDILITHSPPYGILDQVKHNYYSGSVGNMKPDPKFESVGSLSLFNWLKYVGRPKLHVFGHIHEAYGQCEVFPTYDMRMMQSVNASIVNEHYEPVNKPIRVIL